MMDEQPKCSICGEPAVFQVEVSIYVSMALMKEWETDPEGGDKYHPESIGSADTWRDKNFCRTHGLGINARKYGEKVKILVEGDYAAREAHLAELIGKKLFVLGGFWKSHKSWEYDKHHREFYLEKGRKVAQSIMHMGLA